MKNKTLVRSKKFTALIVRVNCYGGEIHSALCSDERYCMKKYAESVEDPMPEFDEIDVYVRKENSSHTKTKTV